MLADGDLGRVECYGGGGWMVTLVAAGMVGAGERCEATEETPANCRLAPLWGTFSGTWASRRGETVIFETTMKLGPETRPRLFLFVGQGLSKCILLKLMMLKRSCLQFEK